VSALSSDQLARVDALLDELLDLPAESRPSFLASECPDDAAVRSEVSSLLKAAGSVGGFLSTPLTLTTEPQLEDIAPGTCIGTWRVTNRIGRGGMGVVYGPREPQTISSSVSQSSCSGRKPLLSCLAFTVSAGSSRGWSIPVSRASTTVA